MINLNKGSIGLITDSHSMNSLMTKAIHILKDMGAKTIIHLGDICDSLTPEKLDIAVNILNKYNVKAIMGNNEYILTIEYLANHYNRFEKRTISFLKELPYTITAKDICFTHSLPYNWPAATRQPISEYLSILKGDNLPFRIIFRGHSHTTSVIEIENECYTNLIVDLGKKIYLHKNRGYVITVGAVENGICALFDPINSEFCSIII